MQISDHDLFIRFTIQYSSIALLIYDYSLTLTDEIKYFWLKKFKISTALYIACRYALISNILFLFALADKFPHLSCNNTYKLCAALSVVGRAAIVFVWGIRTYAVYNKSKWILLVLGPLGVAVVGLDISHVPWVACVSNHPGNPTVDSLLLIFMVVYEFLAAFLATFRIWQASRISGLREAKWSGLMPLVLREGLFYLCSVSIATLIAFILLLTSNGTFIQRLLNAVTLPMSGFLTARFLLHLRRWVAESNGDEDSLDQPNIVLDFLDSAQAATQQSVVNEFGEDPVLRERNRERESIQVER